MDTKIRYSKLIIYSYNLVAISRIIRRRYASYLFRYVIN